MNMFLPLSLARSLWHQSTNRSNVQASSIASSNVFSATPRLLWTIAISFSHMDMCFGESSTWVLRGLSHGAWA
uniref:Uncharacterized protein n=1 Tax=Rhizophora mucronata TaxID=61149 RepID=A0A2P2KYW5_RHIMU